MGGHENSLPITSHNSSSSSSLTPLQCTCIFYYSLFIHTALQGQIVCCVQMWLTAPLDLATLIHLATLIQTKWLAVASLYAARTPKKQQTWMHTGCVQGQLKTQFSRNNSDEQLHVNSCTGHWFVHANNCFWSSRQLGALLWGSQLQPSPMLQRTCVAPLYTWLGWGAEAA